MRTKQHFINMLAQNPNASIGFTLAAAMVYAARYGVCEREHHGTEEWKNIARMLKSRYGETLDADQVRAEMNRTNWAAAASLGKLGGSVTSDAKRKSSAENGRKGGRPRKHV